MKKTFLLLLAASVVISSCKKTADKTNEGDNSSNTVDPCTMSISSNDGPAAGDLFLLGTDNSFNDTNLFKKTGSAQTWDFSALISSQQDTFQFMSSLSTTLGTAFPSANMIISAQGLDLAAIKSTTGISIIATELPPIINNISITPAFTDPAVFIPYPLQKGGSFNDTYSAGVTMRYDTTLLSGLVVIDSIRATLTGSNSFVIDGCGKITTPSGTYDCVKYKLTPGTLVEKYEGRANGTWTDFTVMIKGLAGFKTPEFPLINSKAYVWVSKDKKFPVCMINVDASGNATSVQYLK
ncbi:MAG: hypothetical protein NT150_08350 [Bacteroidetes bacterium]|nr:hypothetical protein [Bacteroidota bacterium]